MSEAPESVVLTTVPSEVEAAAIVNALLAHGVPAASEGGLISGYRAEAPGGVRVLVNEPDLQRAEAMLAEIKRELADIDWSEVDVGEEE